MTDTIGQVLTALGATQPQSTAVHAPGRARLSYAALAAQLEYTGRTLASHGIRPGDVVVGVVQQRAELAVAVAAMPAGCTFAPLAVDLSDEVYRNLLTRLRPKAVLVERASTHAVRTLAAELDITLIELIGDPAAPAGSFELAVTHATQSLESVPAALPEDAFVLATSGTTGTPKLVPMGHANVTSFVRSAIECLGIAPTDIAAVQAPFHLGGGVRNALLTPLLSGACVAVLAPADVPAFYAALDEYQVTFATNSFAFYREVLQRAEEFRSAATGHQLRFLQTRSGALDPAEIEQLEAAFDVPVVIGYSASETGLVALDRLPPYPRKRGAVGKAHGNAVMVLDGAGNPVPAGMPGQMAVRGPMVFRGYLDDPALTARAFKNGWFLTGDLATIDADQFVFVAGRLSDVINRGGEKISPAEIDAALESVAGIKEAGTFGVPHPTLGEEVVAAIVPVDGATIDVAQILEHTRSRVGVRRAPRQLIVVDALPRTSNGKLQRAKLREMTGLSAVASSTAARALTSPSIHAAPLEAALGGLWRAVLEIDQANPDDDFFMLGGDSLRGTRLIAHVRTLFGVELSIAQLFAEASTVAGMARAIEALRAKAPQTE